MPAARASHDAPGPGACVYYAPVHGPLVHRPLVHGALVQGALRHGMSSSANGVARSTAPNTAPASQAKRARLAASASTNGSRPRSAIAVATLRSPAMVLKSSPHQVLP